jgi:hypothetical protein
MGQSEEDRIMASCINCIKTHEAKWSPEFIGGKLEYDCAGERQQQL